MHPFDRTEFGFEVLRFLLRLLGLRLFLLLYNLIASDSKHITEKEPIPFPTPVTTIVIKQPPCGDISHWKTVTDWNIMPHPMLMGTKATQSVDYRDPTFPEYFRNFTTLTHCRRLAYHFFEKTQDPVRQANWFCDYIAPYITSQDLLCLDFEQGGETAPQLWAFLDRVHQRYPQNQLITYSRKNLYDPIVMTQSEINYFKALPTWPAGYPYDPNPYTTTPAGYIPRQDHWGKVWLWQYTDQGPFYGVTNGMDSNLIEPACIEWLGGTVPPPQQDTVTHPYEGVLRKEGRRYNSDVYITIMDADKILFQVVHERPFDNGLFLTSQASAQKASQFGWNADEWDKNVPLPAYPKNYAVEGGIVYVPRTSAEPSLIIHKDRTVNIIHTVDNLAVNATTGRRYLIENGTIAPYLSGPEDQYTERHPRGLIGITKNRDKVIRVTVDGRSNVSAGVTLKEGANILASEGAWWAFDQGGGGDAVDVMDGKVQNVPCDTGVNGQPGVERAIVQALLAFAQGGTMPTSRYEATAIGNGTRIRVTHDTSGKYVNSYDANTKFQGKDTINDANTVNGLFTAPADLSSGGSVYQKKGDKWLAIATVNGQPPLNMDTGQPVTNQTWVAIVHMGGAICTIVDNQVPPEPPDETAIHVTSVVKVDGFEQITLSGDALPEGAGLRITGKAAVQPAVVTDKEMAARITLTEEQKHG